MKMTYKNLSSSEFEQSLKSLSPGVKDFEVELSLDGNAPETLHTGSEKMSLDNILELVEKQGFKVNDVDAVTSEGKWRHCVGVTLNKPFIHDKTKEDIEGLFILGNAYDKAITTSLYSFLIHAESSTRSINFSIDILAKSKDDAKDSFFKKIASFDYRSQKEISFIPVTYANGDWVEMEPEEDEDEIRFQIGDITLEKIYEIFN